VAAGQPCDFAGLDVSGNLVEEYCGSRGVGITG
jgi:hypothetical protein